jgi:hypothetical protein
MVALAEAKQKTTRTSSPAGPFRARHQMADLVGSASPRSSSGWPRRGLGSPALVSRQVAEEAAESEAQGASPAPPWTLYALGFLQHSIGIRIVAREGGGRRSKPLGFLAPPGSSDHARRFRMDLDMFSPLASVWSGSSTPATILSQQRPRGGNPKRGRFHRIQLTLAPQHGRRMCHAEGCSGSEALPVARRMRERLAQSCSDGPSCVRSLCMNLRSILIPYVDLLQQENQFRQHVRLRQGPLQPVGGGLRGTDGEPRLG